MADASQYIFTHREVVEALIKKQGLHEGVWSLSVEFGIVAANTGPSEDQIFPTAIVPLMKIGLSRGTKEGALAVDAAKVNPPEIEQEKLQFADAQ